MSLLQKLMGSSGSKAKAGGNGQQRLPGLQGFPTTDPPPPLPDLAELEASIAAATARADALDVDDDALFDASLLVEPPQIGEDEDVVIEEGELEELEAELEALQASLGELVGEELAATTVIATSPVTPLPTAALQHPTPSPTSQFPPLPSVQQQQQQEPVLERPQALANAVPSYQHQTPQSRQGQQEEEEEEEEAGTAPLAG